MTSHVDCASSYPAFRRHRRGVADRIRGGAVLIDETAARPKRRQKLRSENVQGGLDHPQQSRSIPDASAGTEFRKFSHRATDLPRCPVHTRTGAKNRGRRAPNRRFRRCFPQLRRGRLRIPAQGLCGTDAASDGSTAHGPNDYMKTTLVDPTGPRKRRANRCGLIFAVDSSNGGFRRH